MMRIRYKGVVIFNINGKWKSIRAASMNALEKVLPFYDIPACEPDKEWYQVRMAKELLSATMLSPPPIPNRLHQNKIF